MASTFVSERFLDRDEAIGLLVDYYYNENILWWMKRLHLYGLLLVIMFGIIFGYIINIYILIALSLLSVFVALVIRFSYQGLAKLVEGVARPFPKVSQQLKLDIPCFKCERPIASSGDLSLAKVHNQSQPFHRNCYQELWQNLSMRKSLRLLPEIQTGPNQEFEPTEFIKTMPVIGIFLVYLWLSALVGILTLGNMTLYYGYSLLFVIYLYSLFFLVFWFIGASVRRLSYARFLKIQLIVKAQDQSNKQ